MPAGTSGTLRPDWLTNVIDKQALTDMESWARMREMHGLSFEEACTVWVNAIDRMLPPTPSAK